jgi:rhomboid protease GluP
MLAPRAAGAAPSDPRAGRLDFERGMTYAPPLTLSILATLVGVFAWQVSSGALASAEAIIAAGALVRDRVVVPGAVLGGEWWRMFTATLLHGGPDHLIGNAISLYVLGMACEHAFGSARYAGIYLASALGGSVVSVLLAPGPSVGASGAIFGLMGAVIAHLIKHQHRFYVRDKRIGIVLLAWAAFILAEGFASPFVDNGAHVGGLLTGVVAGLVTPSRLLAEGEARRRPPAR